MSEQTEPRKIKKIVRKPEAQPRLTRKEIDEIVEGSAPVNPYVQNMRKQRRGPIDTLIDESVKAKPKNPPRTKPVKADVKHAAGASVPRTVEGYTTLMQLAAERGIQGQLARIWVLNAGMQRPADGWRWKNSSRELAKARKALELPVA